VGFVVDKAVLGRSFLALLHFPIIIIFQNALY
jgi:hypothetical protein